MNRFFSVIGLICLVFVFYTCTKESIYTEPEDYLPLKVGNYWEFNGYGMHTTTYLIDSIVNIDGKDYFRLVSSTTGYPNNDTVFYRKDPLGKVYARSKSLDEVLKFDFSAAVGSHWQNLTDPPYIDNYPWTVTLNTKSDTVKSNNCTFENCYRFYYDIPQSADEEYGWVLAPGIGFVKQVSYGWGFCYRIKKVKINGVVREF